MHTTYTGITTFLPLSRLGEPTPDGPTTGVLRASFPRLDHKASMLELKCRVLGMCGLVVAAMVIHRKNRPKAKRCQNVTVKGGGVGGGGVGGSHYLAWISSFSGCLGSFYRRRWGGGDTAQLESPVHDANVNGRSTAQFRNRCPTSARRLQTCPRCRRRRTGAVRGRGQSKN